MDIREKQHNRVVALVGIIIGLAVVSLWQEFSHLQAGG